MNFKNWKIKRNQSCSLFSGLFPRLKLIFKNQCFGKFDMPCSVHIAKKTKKQKKNKKKNTVVHQVILTFYFSQFLNQSSQTCRNVGYKNQAKVSEIQLIEMSIQSDQEKTTLTHHFLTGFSSVHEAFGDSTWCQQLIPWKREKTWITKLGERETSLKPVSQRCTVISIVTGSP